MQEREEIVKQIVAISMAGIDQPLWETRLKVEQELEKWWQARAATDEEPILLKAGDRRVLINGKPPLVDCRIVAESVYQRLARRTRLWQKFGM